MEPTSTRSPDTRIHLPKIGFDLRTAPAVDGGVFARGSPIAMSTAAVVPILVLSVVLATDAWVYLDDRAQTERGTPVILTFGMFKVDTPGAWFGGCLILWFVFFPLYVMGRRR